MNETKKNFYHSSPPSLYWENTNDREVAKTILSSNGIGIGTTDTIPGFFAPITEAGYQRLCSLKEERGSKPFLIITTLHNIDFFVDRTTLSPRIMNIISHCFPAPLTLILPSRSSLPAWLRSSSETIAVRCPKHENLELLLRSFKGLFSTSANRSNLPSPSTLEEVEPILFEKVDFIIRSHENDEVKIQHSTIVDCTSSQPLLLRKGAFPFSEVMYHYDKS